MGLDINLSALGNIPEAELIDQIGKLAYHLDRPNQVFEYNGRLVTHETSPEATTPVSEQSLQQVIAKIGELRAKPGFTAPPSLAKNQATLEKWAKASQQREEMPQGHSQTWGENSLRALLEVIQKTFQ